jgi:hypothetical protein
MENFLLVNLLVIIPFSHMNQLINASSCHMKKYINAFIYHEKMDGKAPIGHPINPFIIILLFGLSHPKTLMLGANDISVHTWANKKFPQLNHAS